ncbi:hypothetical protein [Leptospira santarosai]|uniref:hypothetical protein n=1 Tax=Leptospira santarosai TaxID=28183 RepID=UPI00051892FC|nr:hypothetical protein [Leptospira santarosai]
MTPQQRREYIAEKIFRAKKKFKYITWLHFPGKELQPPFDWQFPDGRIVDSKTDFESLPEWTGPICDVVLPMMGDEFFTIESWGDGDISILYNGDLEIIGKRNFRTALIDAHMKISEEKENL